MRHIGVMVVCFLISFSFVGAQGDYSDRDEYGEVKYYDFKLDIERDGDIVKLEWDDFPREKGFKWYKVMYSTTVKIPVYPDQSAVYVGSQRTNVQHKIALKNDEDHYFRICAITQNDDYSKERYCGKTVHITVEHEENDEATPEEKKQYTLRYKDVAYHDFDFQVNVSDDGIAKVRWNSYLKDRGFKYYKLMYSTKYANPSYPELSAKYVGDDISDSGKSFRISSGEKHYFRICAITDEGYGVVGRYCSSTRKIVIEENENDTNDSEDAEDDKRDHDDISDDLRKKINERLKSFILGLEEKGYGDAEMVRIINSVIERLERYTQNEKYKAIAIYMQELLKRYRGTYENELDIFEDIFGEY